jgi:hypothetical protein
MLYARVEYIRYDLLAHKNLLKLNVGIGIKVPSARVGFIYVVKTIASERAIE